MVPARWTGNEIMELTWQQVEHACCMWMRANGYPDVRLTRFGADGGIDIESREAVAQVKHQSIWSDGRCFKCSTALLWRSRPAAGGPDSHARRPGLVRTFASWRADGHSLASFALVAMAIGAG